MYINIGNGYMIRAEKIVAVFDFESATVQRKTRDFLSAAQRAGRIINISPDLPKSFIVTGNKENQKIYLCPVSSATVLKRAAKFNI